MFIFLLTESNDNLPLIAGGAAAGGIALAIIVIVIVVLLRIYTKRGKLVYHYYYIMHKKLDIDIREIKRYEFKHKKSLDYVPANKVYGYIVTTLSAWLLLELSVDLVVPLTYI